MEWVVLIALEQKRIAVLSESLQVLLAVTMPLEWCPTYYTELRRVMRFDVATPAQPNQIRRVVVREVSILVMHVRCILLPTDFASALRDKLPRMVTASAFLLRLARSRIERRSHAFLIAILPPKEMPHVFQATRKTLPLQELPAELAVFHWVWLSL